MCRLRFVLTVWAAFLLCDQREGRSLELVRSQSASTPRP